MKTKINKVLSFFLALLMVVSIVPFTAIETKAATLSKTAAEAVAWAQSKVGQRLDYDGEPKKYPEQCVDLTKWYYHYLGVTPIIANGNEYAYESKLPSGWKLIKYYNGLVPQPGDIAVWSETLTEAGKLYGHVAIVENASASNMNVIEQSYSTGVIRNTYSYSYGKFFGFVRPNFSSTTGTGSTTTTTTTSTTHWMVEKAINWAVSIANDNTYGYILGANHSWSSSTDYDCSSLVTTAFKKAGFGNWVTSTHYMRSMFEKYGFKWIPASQLGGLKTSANLQRGDILLNEKNHTEIYIGNNQLVGAHANWNGYAGGIGGGKYNSSGKWRSGADEINISNYYSYPWNGVLRYVGNVKPEPPSTPSISIDKTNIAQGKNVTLTWNAVSNATSYTVGISSNTVNKEVNVGNQTSFSFNLAEAQKYNFSVKATGEGGSSSHSSAVSCTAHAPSTVTFVDWDDEVIESVEVKYGEDAKSPEIPTREGYTFSSWDSSYYNITSDKTIKAVYKINTYTVNFIGHKDEILKTEKVQYGEDATPPTETKAPEGYVFQAWENESYKNVYVENGTNLNVHAVYYWENPDIPVICSNATATRQEDGYYVYFDLKNYNLDVTRGRAVVSLKTADDKLVDMSESAAFSLPKEGTKTNMEVFIPCDKAATNVEIVIVNSYSSGVPISDKVTTIVSNSEMWSDWSDTKPENTDGTLEVEERTVYKYREKEYTKGNTKTLAGWTWDGTKNAILQSETGYQDSILSEYDNETGKRKLLGTQQVDVYGYRKQYVYYHFYNPTGGSSKNHYWCPYNHGAQGYNNESGKWTYHCIEKWDTPLEDWGTSDCGGYRKYRYADCYSGCNNVSFFGQKYWFLNNGYPKDVWTTVGSKTQYNYATYKYEYNFWKWGDFSEWQTTPVTETDKLDVVPKTQYRYFSNATMVEDNSGIERTISSEKYGKLEAFAGKQLTLFVYKVDGASDYTNEYIGQTEIGENGEYSFTFKLREEPTVKTGDFTVAIGIEGATDLIVIDTIEAPVPEYTVEFYNWEGDVISTQTVKEGENAALPENPVKEGYIFKGWDTSVANVSQNLEIHPVFEKEVYSIIFVDWTKQSIVIEKYEHGDVITPPENSVIVGHDFSGWDMLNEGNVIATGDMVITAVYDKKVYNVNFYDFEGNVISTQRVAYGESAQTPVFSKGANGEIFAGWDNADAFMEVSHDVAVYPIYYFEETTDVPVANYETGEYDSAIELTLTSPDENAVIYYYINDDVENTKQYTGPVTIDTTCSVTYYAQSLGKNDSDSAIRYYCINNAGEYTNWMTYSQIPEEVRSNLADYNLEQEDGYRYKDITTTTLVADVKNLEKTGWAVTGNKTTKYSAWQDATLTADSTLIDCVVETQTVADTSVKNYQYSHYKYTDENGTVCYSPTEVEGYTCEYETITLGAKLSPVGFIEGGEVPISYFNYNNEQWFTQKTVTGTKTQYRLAYSEVEYYKWTAWDIEAPSSSETREYENETVYRYTNKNYHIVEVVDTEGYSTIYLVQSGKTLDITEISDLTGYNFEGLYLDAEYTDSWDYTKAVTESIVVYANYTPKQYTVIFQMQDGTELDSQTVNYMESAIAPETDSVPGWVFAGWDKDFSFVTEDMVVTGKYIKESQYARISLNTNKAMMYAGNRISLIPSITPVNLSGERIEWSSSDPAVAAVDDNGIVTAMSAGEAVITVTVISTKETATCNITVTADSSTTILLNEDSKIGFDTERNLRITPSNAHTVAELKAEFQNTELVFIDSEGNELSEDALVGTGTTIKLMYKGNELDAVDVVLTGDFNCDGSINNKDVVMINQYVLEKRTANNDQMIAIDVNGDGSVNNRDCAMLAQYLVEKVAL